MTLLTWMSINWEMAVFLVLVVAGLISHCWSEFMQMLAARTEAPEVRDWCPPNPLPSAHPPMEDEYFKRHE